MFMFTIHTTLCWVKAARVHFHVNFWQLMFRLAARGTPSIWWVAASTGFVESK